MDTTVTRFPGLRRNAFLICCSLVAVLIQVVPNIAGGYGYFIDEWYYIACAKRLAFGYVDHPPLAPLLLRSVMALAGSSLIVIRILPALAGGATVFLTGRMARELDGGTMAQLLAVLCSILSPGILIACGFYSVNAFEILFWTLSCSIVLSILKTNNPRGWIAFGIVFGLGLEDKHTIVLLGVGLMAGLLLTSSRTQMKSGQFWLGAVIAFLLFLPNLIWEVLNGWPSLEFYVNAVVLKNLPTPPLKGLLNQILIQNPFSLPVWLAGLWYALVSKEGRQFRPVGLAFVFLLIVMLASLSSRADRITGIYPVFFALGGVAMEALSRRSRLTWLNPVLPAIVVAGGVLLAPLGLPILPPETLGTYVQALGVVPKIEKGKSSPLPQWFADRFEWEEFVGTMAGIYDRLPPEDKSRVAIFVPSYGHAGALEYYGPSLGLPRVLCNHNNYYLWGKGNANAEVMLAIGGKVADWRTVYDRVDSVGVIRGVYGMSWRNNMKVFLAREPIVPFDSVWDRIKHYE